MPECAMCVPTCQECCGEAHEPDLAEARIAALEIRVSELERELDIKVGQLELRITELVSDLEN